MDAQRDEPATKRDLDQLKQELVGKIDANGAKIDANGAKIDEVERRLTAKIDANGARIDQVEERLSAKIDANSAKIDEVERRLTAKIDANGARIDQVEERLSAKIDANSTTLSRVSHQVVENREQIDRLVTMSEKFNEYFDEIISTLNGLASGFAHLDSERTAINARLGRVEEDVDKNKSDITKIKAKLAMP